MTDTKLTENTEIDNNFNLLELFEFNSLIEFEEPISLNSIEFI